MLSLLLQLGSALRISAIVNTILEKLEERIAPAVVVAANGLSGTYTDVDGDLVTIKISGGDLNLATFTTSALNIGEQLEKVDFTLGGIDPGASLTFAVKKVITGDGLANVGEIDATGIDLGAVTVKGDLGGIDAGDADFSTVGIGSLKVDSMGVYGVATGAGSTASVVKGDITSLSIKHNFDKALVQTTGGGGIGTLTIGGSIIGGSTGITGCFLIDGSIGKATIGGDIIGGSGASSGTLFAQNLGSLTLGGSLRGGTVVSAGQIDIDGTIGTIKITGDVIGGNGNESGNIVADSFTGSITIGGSLKGGAGAESGNINSAAGDLGSVKIGGDVSGSSGVASGSILSFARLGSVTIGGTLSGGTGDDSGVISCDNQLGAVKIGGDLRGGTAASISGAIGIGGGFISNSIASVTIGGSLIGNSGIFSGAIFTSGSIDKGVKISHDVIGGSATGTESVNFTGSIEAQQSIFNVSIGGSVISGIDSSTGTLTRSASIRANETLGAVTIKGNLIGTTSASGESLAVISAGFGTLPGGAGPAIKSLSVGKGVQNTNIFAGYTVDLMPVNGDAQIGSVKVGKDWVASNLVAGVQNVSSSNTSFGNVNDSVIGGGFLSRIASIAIGGQVVGRAGGTEHFGFAAQAIGSFKSAGFKAPLTSGFDFFIPLSFATADVDIHEVL